MIKYAKEINGLQKLWKAEGGKQETRQGKTLSFSDLISASSKNNMQVCFHRDQRCGNPIWNAESPEIR